MTETTSQQTTNGHRRATERLPFAPYSQGAKPTDEPPTATTDEPLTTSDTPLLDSEGGITAGNETRPEPVSPVEGHDVYVKPAPGRRWEALRDQDVPIPAALRDLGALKTAVRREMRALPERPHPRGRRPAQGGRAVHVVADPRNGHHRDRPGDVAARPRAAPGLVLHSSE